MVINCFPKLVAFLMVRCCYDIFDDMQVNEFSSSKYH